MGNCLKHRSSTTWGGEEWDFIASERLFASDMASDGDFSNVENSEETENESLIGEKNGFSSTEVKIKLTKRQMEELLAKVGIQGLSIEQVLTQLVTTGAEQCHLRHRAWRPALQSIPEVN